MPDPCEQDSPENKCPDPVINLDSDLRPVSVSIPCPATVEAVLGLPEPVTLPCGKLDGHDGEHEYRIGWTDRACPDCRGRGEIEDYEFNPFYSEHSGPVVDKCSACGGSGRINTSGPDDSKIENKYQGASPSVPPAVTTDGVPVVREGREEESRFCEPGVCPCCDAPSVVSGGGQNEARCSRCDNRGWFIRDASGGREVQVACPDCSVEDRIGSRALEAGAKAYSHCYSDVKWEEAAPCTRTLWKQIAGEVIEAALPFLVSTSDEVTVKRSDLIRVMEQATTGMSMSWTSDEDQESYRRIVAALDKKGQDDG